MCTKIFQFYKHLVLVTSHLSAAAGVSLTLLQNPLVTGAVHPEAYYHERTKNFEPESSFFNFFLDFLPAWSRSISLGV